MSIKFKEKAESRSELSHTLVIKQKECLGYIMDDRNRFKYNANGSLSTVPAHHYTRKSWVFVASPNKVKIELEDSSKKGLIKQIQAKYE